MKSKLKPELKPLELKTKSQPEPKPVEVKVKLRSVSKPPIAKPKLKPGLKHSGLKAKLKPIPKLPEVKKKPKPTKIKEVKVVAKPIKRDPKIELYNKYEKKNPGKRAVYRGKETKGFLEWKEKYEKS